MRRRWEGVRWGLCACVAFGMHVAVCFALPQRQAHAAMRSTPGPTQPTEFVDYDPAPGDKPAEPQEQHAVAGSPSRAEPAPKEAVPSRPHLGAPSEPSEEAVAEHDETGSDETMNGSAEGEVDGTAVGGDGAGSGSGGGGEASGTETAGVHEVEGASGGGKPTGQRGLAKLELGRDWSDCPFPEKTKRKSAFVRIRVLVDATGEALFVKVLSDPGEGFGESAKSCAQHRRYVAGTDLAGQKSATETAPFLVFFSR